MKWLFNPLLKRIGYICYFYSVIQLIPLSYALIIRESMDSAYGFLASIAISILVGMIFGFLGRSSKETANKGHGYIAAALVALVMVLIGSVPYIFNANLQFHKAIFESASGLSTTGVTVFEDVTILSRSMLLYRGLTQWFGGVLFIAYFMMVGFKSEDQISLGYTSALFNLKLPKKINNVYKGVITFMALYLILTLTETFVLLGLGLPIFEAFTNTLSIVSTGGFATHSEGLAGVFSQNGIEFASVSFVLSGLMILSGFGYYVFIRLASKDFKGFRSDPEMKTYGVIGLVAVLISLGILILKGVVVSDSFSEVVFWVSSSLATYGVGNIRFIGVAEMVMIALSLGVIGGMMGSVTSGIKINRVRIMARSIGFEADQIFKSSHEVTLLKMDGKTINTRIILKLSIFILAWVIIAMLGIFGIILMTNMEGSAATVSVIGAMANGGIIHPTYVLYNDMNASALYLYSILMVIGRLEIMPFLVLFRRSAWK